jgi:hypothetical protein
MKKLFLLFLFLSLAGVTCQTTQEIACGYEGQRYEAGQSFPAADGCNTCTCELDGSISCTEIACATAVDECQTSSDCLRQAIDTSFCADGEWACVNSMCEYQCDLGL